MCRVPTLMTLFFLLMVMAAVVVASMKLHVSEVTSSFPLIGHLQSGGCWHCLWHLILHMCNATAFPASTKTKSMSGYVL